MKKSKTNQMAIPRKARVISNLFVIVILCTLLFVFAQRPALTAKRQFRRMEKSNFVGPATILDTISIDYYPYNRLLLATNENGVTVFSYDKNNLKVNDFTYREKKGNTAVLALPNRSGQSFATKFEANIPIVVFDSYPEAARCELYIKLTDGESFEQEYTMEAGRGGNGFFLFMLSVSRTKELGREGVAMELLTQISDDTPYAANGEIVMPATVRYYDAENVMICEDTVYICSPAGSVHNPAEISSN